MLDDPVLQIGGGSRDPCRGMMAEDGQQRDKAAAGAPCRMKNPARAPGRGGVEHRRRGRDQAVA